MEINKINSIVYFVYILLFIYAFLTTEYPDATGFEHIANGLQTRVNAHTVFHDSSSSSSSGIQYTK